MSTLMTSLSTIDVYKGILDVSLPFKKIEVFIIDYMS